MSQLRVDITANGAGIQRGLNQASGAVRNWAGQVKGHIASAFGGAAITAMFQQASEGIGRMEDSAGAMGRTVEEVQALAIAAQLAGKSLENVDRLLQSISEAQIDAIQNPEGAKAATFSRLGFKTSDLQNMNELAVLQKIATDLKGLSATQVRAQTTDLIGKKNVGTLVGMQGDLANFDQNKRSLMSAGSILSGADVTQYALAVDQFSLAWQTLMTQLKSMFLPTVIEIVNFLTMGLVTWRQGLKTTWAMMKTIFDWVSGAGAGGIEALNKGLALDLKLGQTNILKEALKMEKNKAAMAEATRKQEELSKLGPGAIPKPTEPASPVEPTKKERTRELMTDDLLSVGNFLGQNMGSLQAANSLLSETKEQTGVLRKILNALQNPMNINSWTQQFSP